VIGHHDHLLAADGKLASASPSSTVPVTVWWNVAPAGGPVCSQAVQKSVNRGATWTSLHPPRANATKLTTTITPGKATLFRVRAVGCADVPGNWTTSAPTTARILQQTANGIKYTRGWKKVNCTPCSGGSQEQSSAKKAAVTINISGARAIALVLTEGRANGSAHITGGGSTAATISTHAASTRYRRFAYARNWTARGKRSITITNLATPDHPDIQFDAVVVLT